MRFFQRQLQLPHKVKPTFFCHKIYSKCCDSVGFFVFPSSLGDLS
ncbi:hypothetical protein BLL52_1424 [Rhodoferax antarcticus ANT.BR]|uniref:Uncharacterized protein n=1 Tax=Rhodoferax antarcticus ANT.BR TaxID=1111071 RepID=A0A1Q8YHQ7_9BURK|nr:hypothetical protein BLL52_1424 [Rhodoferax antarcticus ANT.BR]